MNGNTFKTAVLVFGMTVFLSNYSFAQSGKRVNVKKPRSFEHLIKDMDANDDGKLSKEELKSPLKDDFSMVDTNDDGFITEEELKKAPRPKRGPKR